MLGLRRLTSITTDLTMVASDAVPKELQPRGVSHLKRGAKLRKSSSLNDSGRPSWSLLGSTVCDAAPVYASPPCAIPFFGVKCQLYIDYVNKLYFLGRRIQYNVVGELLVIDQGGLHQGRRCCGRRWE